MYKSFSIIIAVVIFSSVGTSCQQSSAQKKVTVEEKIGQMLMIGFKGYAVEDTSHVIRDIKEYHTGGFILFDYDVPTSSPERNIESPDQVKKLTSQLRELADHSLFLAVDQEGGRVARLKPERGFQDHVSAQYLGQLDNPDSTRFYASKMSKQLRGLGFNINFAPVVDLNTNPENPVIGQLERSFGDDAELVIKQASIFLEEFDKQGVAGVLKHFPGHGSAWNDSHVGMADVTDTWERVELEPYHRLIDSEQNFAIMTAHVFNENLDPEYPATLSKAVQTDLLREELEYEGVLFSDDMQMDAIRTFYGLETAIEQAINAGVDVLVFGNNSVYDPDIVPKATQIIKDLIDMGKIDEARIDKSYERIQKLKEKLVNE